MTEKVEGTPKKQKRRLKQRLDFASGFYEILLGTMIILEAVVYFFLHFYNFFIFFGALILCLLILYLLINYLIVKPRFAIFSAQYQPSKWREKIGKTPPRIAIAVMMLICLFMTGIPLNYLLRWNIKFISDVSDIGRWFLYLMVGVVYLLGLFVAAYRYDTPRVIFFYFLLFLCMLSPIILPSEFVLWAWLVIGVVALVSGTIALVCFTRKYPLPEEEAEQSSVV